MYLKLCKGVPRGSATHKAHEPVIYESLKPSFVLEQLIQSHATCLDIALDVRAISMLAVCGCHVMMEPHAASAFS